MTAEVREGRGQEVSSAGEPREADFSSSLGAGACVFVWPPGVEPPLEELLTPRRKGVGPSMSLYLHKV